MKKSSRFMLLGIFMLAMLTQFNNCGGGYTVANTIGAGDASSVAVAAEVWPRTDSTLSNPIPLSISKAAVPFAIDFGANPNFDEGSATTSWGAWLSAWHDLPSNAPAVLGQPKFLYRLDMIKNTVIDLTSDQLVYKLSSKDAAKLASIVSSSILANAHDFKATANCQPTEAEGYATLETNYGLFDLGAGAPCAPADLFKNNGSGKDAGLDDFIAKIQGNAH